MIAGPLKGVLWCLGSLFKAAIQEKNLTQALGLPPHLNANFWLEKSYLSYNSLVRRNGHPRSCRWLMTLARHKAHPPIGVPRGRHGDPEMAAGPSAASDRFLTMRTFSTSFLLLCCSIVTLLTVQMCRTETEHFQDWCSRAAKLAVNPMEDRRTDTITLYF